jgi:hypothetical protein
VLRRRTEVDQSGSGREAAHIERKEFLMRGKFRVPRPSAAMIVAVVALVMALAGTGYAAKLLGLGAFKEGVKNKTVGVGKLTYVTTNTNIPSGPSGENAAVSASCPSGFKVIGGGVKTPSPPPPPADIGVVNSYPTTTGWAGHVDNFTPGSITATTTAICARSRAVTGAPPAP